MPLEIIIKRIWAAPKLYKNAERSWVCSINPIISINKTISAILSPLPKLILAKILLTIENQPTPSTSKLLPINKPGILRKKRSIILPSVLLFQLQKIKGVSSKKALRIHIIRQQDLKKQWNSMWRSQLISEIRIKEILT